MLTLRVKGKYVVLASVLLLVLSGVLYITAVRAVAMRGLAEDNWDPLETIRVLTETYPNPDDAARELYFSAMKDADGLPEQQRNMVFIFPMGSMSSPLISQQEGRLARAMEKCFLVRKHFPETIWAVHALAMIAQLHYNVGNYDLVEEYALAAIAEGGWEAVGSTNLLARMYLDQGNARTALKLIEEFLREKPDHLSLEMLYFQGRALLALREWERAEQIFLAMSQRAEDVYTLPADDEGSRWANIEHWEEIARRNLERLAALRQGDGKTGTISGRVQLGTEGMAGARVYLVDQSVPRKYFSTAEYGDMRQLVSNVDGSFQFDDVIPGRYVLGVGVQMPAVQGFTLREQQEFVVEAGRLSEQILTFTSIATVREPLGGDVVNGTVVFRWDEVDGATSYNLNVTPIKRSDGNMGSYTTVLRSKIVENRLVVNLEEELKKARFFPSFGHSDGKLNPDSVFGQIYAGGEFAWSVTAFDAQGKKISDSTGYGMIVGEANLPLFEIRGEISSADKLVWEGEYEQAVAAYKKQLASNSQDTHALLILARIHQFGPRYEERDLDKAADYYERLIKIEDSLDARKALAQVYSDLERYVKAYELYQTLLGAGLEEGPIHLELAKGEFQLGQPKVALERLNLAVDMAYGVYARSYPVALALVLGENEHALSFARKVDGSERYRELLVGYIKGGYTVKEPFRQAMLNGDYTKAQELLDDSMQDRFIGILVSYLKQGNITEIQERLIIEMEQGLHKNLAQNMFIYY